MTTRKQFIDDVVYCLKDEEVATMFGATKQELEEGTWNQNLEYAYNEYVSQIEAEQEQEDYEPHDERCCDLTGYCSGTSCPNYWNCH